MAENIKNSFELNIGRKVKLCVKEDGKKALEWEKSRVNNYFAIIVFLRIP